MKKALIVVVALLVLIVGGLFVVPPLLSWDFLKTRIAAAVKAETGHEVEIGEISLRILPSVAAEVSDLRVSASQDDSEQPLLTLGKLDFGLALWPLLTKSVEIDRLILQDLAVNLRVNEAGQANWVSAGNVPQASSSGGGQTKTTEADSGEAGEFPLSNLVLGDVRLSDAMISYRDAVSGQAIAVSNADFKASLPGLAGQFDLNGGMVVNEQQVTLDFALNSPEAFLSGDAASLKSDLASPLLTLGSDLRLQSEPQAAVDGTAELDIVSMGELLAWLQRPLPAGQEDPGSVALAATFKTEGAKVVLEEATLSGEDLDAKASGSFDGSGDAPKISLLVESGDLNIDRYLPPQTAPPHKQGGQRVHKDRAAKHSAMKQDGNGDNGGDDPMGGISDAPFDFAALRGVEADIRVALGGIKAIGYAVGPIDLTATMKDGLLDAELAKLALYGGDVTGKAHLDATGDAADVSADFDLSKVDLGALSAVGADGPPPVSGVASAKLTAAGVGASPQALVQDLKGGLTFKLGKIDVAQAPAASLSGVDLALDLPGLAKSPSLKGSLVYNREKVTLGLSMDPLDKVLAGNTFALKADVASPKISLGYDGSVQQKPLSGLDGDFHLDVPSVGSLAAWLGQPLPKGQPDPGPLKVAAVLQAAGEKIALQQATIQGDNLNVRANGEVEIGQDVTNVSLDVTGGFLDIDRYLPASPAGKKRKKAGKAAGGKKPTVVVDGPTNILASLPDDRIDLQAFKKLNADIKIALDGVKSGGVEVAPVNATLAAKDGVLTLDLADMGLYGGTVSSHASVKAIKDNLESEFALNLGSVALGDLLKAAGNEPPPASGVTALAVTAKTAGKSPRGLVEGMIANISLSLDEAAVAALPDAQIDDLHLDFDLPGLATPAKGALDLKLNGEAAKLDLDVDSLQKALSGETFAFKALLSSKALQANVDGTLQQAPLPGFSGDITAKVDSVEGLLKWLGETLPEGQQDPGALDFVAKLSADGQKLSVESLSLDGNAVKMTGNGSYDGSGEIAKFDGLLDIANLDLNAYLPPPGTEATPSDGGKDAAKGSGGKKKKKKAAQKGWSQKPFKLRALRQAEGTLKVKSGPITYRTVKIEKSVTNLSLDGGVLTTTVDNLKLEKGRATANVVVDASTNAADLSYNVSLKGIASQPFLESFVGIDWLSGTLLFETQGKAKGKNEKEVVNSLNGMGSFTFKNGAIEGFDLAETLRNAKSLGVSTIEGAKRPKTEFTELSGSYTTTNGLLKNRDLKMLAPLVRVKGSGDVDLPPQTLDYQVEAKLVGSLEGQGGDDSMAGLPIPIHASGPWDALKIDIDWESLLTSGVVDVEKLPGDLGGVAKELLGESSDGDSKGGLEGAVGGALNQLLGGSKDSDAKAQSSGTKSTKKKKKKKAKSE